MSLLPVWEEIEKLSPDAATLERCYRLASNRYIKDIGTCNLFIWGKIKTSGAAFYQVCWQLDTLIAASNSPIYPKPDKYALALAFYYCKNTQAFECCEEVPPWVIQYVTKKPLTEFQSSEKEAENQLLREKNQLKRQTEMLQGCFVLTLWIEDCLRMGFARLREQTYPFWESVASRLNDFKLNGIAARLLPLFYYRNEEDWIPLCTKQFGEIILFCEAFQKWDDFSPENQQDLLIYGGATIKKEAVLSEPAFADEWFVCSISYEKISNDLNARFVWLLGINSKQFAQLISYSWRGEKWENHFEINTSIKGNIHYYPSGFPQRAILQISDDYVSKSSTFPNGYKEWDSFFDSYRIACKQNFLLEEFPGILQHVRVLAEESSYLQDKNNSKIKISPLFKEKWELIAVSQNKPISVFGTWNGLYFLPRSYSY